MLNSYTIVILFYALQFNAEVSGSNKISIDYQKSILDKKQFKRFWTNTGFSPLENNAIFFESIDLNTNLEIIGSLPNNGLKNVRIHWLLDLLTIKGHDNKIPIYEFRKLDKFLIKLIKEYNLFPTIEFMTSLNFTKKNKEFWEDYSYKIISHYIEKFGAANILKWKFETWNEPDLPVYNQLNFTLVEYIDYINGIKAGLDKINREYYLHRKIKLRGPAGLFKDYDKHKFCWNVLENCNNNLSNCPIDIITFHRKGNGDNADEIIDVSLSLLKEFAIKFPHLVKMKYSNTEADPIKNWSEPREFQSNMRYASILVETVFQHWKMLYNGQMFNLESISHDNSFLNFYPNIFTQRTLLARFQINNTNPKYLQFIRKPVFTALGLLSNLGKYASNLRSVKKNNISYIVSLNNHTEKFFSCIILMSHVRNKTYSNNASIYELKVKNLPKRDDLMFLVEAIDNDKTNPHKIYEMLNKPKYPDLNAIQAMRKVQGPFILEKSSKVVDGKIIVNGLLKEPFVLSIRICSRNIVDKNYRIKNLRIRKVNSQEILLFWSENFQGERCVKTYEIYFKNDNSSYQQIESKYNPFLYHQFQHSIPGCFKVRSRDLFNRVSKFSKEMCLKNFFVE